MRRREKRDWRFVRLEKTPTPKSLSPLDRKLLEMGKDERQSQSSTPNQTIKQSNNQSNNKSTNREVKTDPALNVKPEMKHSLAGLLARERELMS